MTARTNRQREKKFGKLAADFRAQIAKGKYKLAIKAAKKALAMSPDNPGVLSDYAFSLMRDKQYQAAYAAYLKIYRSPQEAWLQASATWLDGLAECCGWLEKPDELKFFGHLALTRADNRYGTAPAFPYPAQAAPAFNPDSPAENVIAFTLFGGLPKYCEAAVINAKTALDLFPAWCCRFYLDRDVPEPVSRRLAEARAEIVRMDSSVSAIHPLLWRFRVLDDKAVKRFLIRDADSLLSEREQAAVGAWVESDFWFHHMRDYFTHTELLLAGLFGGCNGVVAGVEERMTTYCRKAGANSGRFIDQHFLREALWPTVRQSLLSHDEIFGFHDPSPFPPHPPVRWQGAFHVGSNVSYQTAQGRSDLADGAQQGWRLRDENGDVVCQYASPVERGHWSTTLPAPYIDAVRDEGWYFELL